MTLTSGTRITLSQTMTRQITDLLVVCDDLLRNGSNTVRAQLARSLPIGDFRPDEVALFIDVVGFTALHLSSQLAQAEHDGLDAADATQHGEQDGDGDE